MNQEKKELRLIKNIPSIIYIVKKTILFDVSELKSYQFTLINEANKIVE